MAWLGIALVTLAASVVVTILVANKATDSFDQPLLAAAVSSLGSWKLLWDVMSEVGNYPMIPIALGFVVWLFWRKRKREALLVLVILAVATIYSEGIKALVARPRPEGPVPGIPGVVYSYPSGHTLEDPMILGMVATRLWRSTQAAALRIGFAVVSIAIVVLVGLARLAINVHYPSDVIGGLFMGVSFLGFYAWGTKRGAWADHPADP